MKKIILSLTALLIATSCQSESKNGSEANSLNPLKAFQALIKSDKKKQSDLDLPFRGFQIDKNIETLAFGSCADQDQPQPIWASIEKNQPELMLMLGDNVYASSATQKPISEQYKKLKKIAEYRSIREKVPFMATWDDHDYGKNDGGETNTDKEEAKIQFFKNWPYLKDIVNEKQDGIYHAKIFGEKKNTLQIIMLDTRSNRSDLKMNSEQSDAEKMTSPKPYLPDTDKSKHFLSEKQWSWFESELKKPAGLRIIASSIQLIANDHQFEKWGNFPKERERFFNLLKKLKIKNAIVISGDRHMAAIAKKDLAEIGTLYDITSSGLNKPARPGNSLTDTSYISEGYGPVNFGLIKINWTTRKSHIEIKSLENEVVQSVDVNF